MVSRAFAFSSLDDWWDEGKREIKRLSIDYCKKRASARRTERDLLVRLAEFLKQRVDSGAMFCFGPYQSTLSSLAKFDLEAGGVPRSAVVPAGLRRVSPPLLTFSVW